MHNKLIKPCLLAVLFLPLVVTAQSESSDTQEHSQKYIECFYGSTQNSDECADKIEENAQKFKRLLESLEASTKTDPTSKTPWWKGGGIWTPLPPDYGRADG